MTKHQWLPRSQYGLAIWNTGSFLWSGTAGEEKKTLAAFFYVSHPPQCCAYILMLIANYMLVAIDNLTVNINFTETPPSLGSRADDDLNLASFLIVIFL